MNPIWILLLLILSAALPLILVFCWFSFKKSPVTFPWFLTALIAGIISLFVAVLLQNFFPYFDRSGQGRALTFFFDVFIRIAFLEELSRLIVLVPLFHAIQRRRKMDVSFYASLGLVAGLGFAMFENAFYGLADANITLLRAFTSAPLHGACGIRVALAVFFFTHSPAKALFLFLFAVLVHGAYNMMIVSPALPSALAILVAFTALFSALPFLRATNRDTREYGSRI